MEGYIKIHRKLLENPLCERPHYAWVWVVLLLKAAYNEKEVLWNGSTIKLSPGQFITGRNSLAIQTKIKPSTIEDVLTHLETQQQIRQQKSNRCRIITIVNWEKYQIASEKSDSQSNNKATTKQQQSNTNKKERKKEYNNTTNILLAPPSGAVKNLNPIIDLFKGVNPSYETIFKNKTERNALERMVKKFGEEKVAAMIKYIEKSNGEDFAPVITKPTELERNLGKLVAYYKRQKGRDDKNKILIL